jgi:hypothetical protein
VNECKPLELGEAAVDAERSAAEASKNRMVTFAPARSDIVEKAFSKESVGRAGPTAQLASAMPPMFSLMLLPATQSPLQLNCDASRHSCVYRP